MKLWWGDLGRNHILDEQAIESHLGTLDENVGMTYTPDTIRDILVDAKKKKLEQKGEVAVDVNVSAKSVMRTVALMAMDKRTTISQSVLLKTNRRHIADHSLNNALYISYGSSNNSLYNWERMSSKYQIKNDRRSNHAS
jgi:hypothetical protein